MRVEVLAQKRIEGRTPEATFEEPEEPSAFLVRYA